MNWKSFVNKIKKYMLSAGAEEAEYRSVEDEIMRSNRSILVVFTNVVCILLACLFVTSYVVEGLGGNRVIYGSFTVICLMLSCLAWKAEKRKTQIFFVTYLFMGALLAIGVILGTVWGKHEITASFIAILLITPQLFTDRPWRFYLLIIGSMVVFIVMAFTFKDEVTWTSDITNVLVFGVMSAAVCTYTINNRVTRFILESRNRMLAEYDQLTGMRNRNSYELRLQELKSEHVKNMFCIYIDVNGLHELNNSQGHEAGDRMLRFVAEAAAELFATDTVYRIGGDEFVILGTQLDPTEIDGRIVQLKAKVQSENYHVAVGLEFSRDVSEPITTMVKAAERMMYQDKAAYYRQSGIDRRKNRT